MVRPVQILRQIAQLVEYMIRDSGAHVQIQVWSIIIINIYIIYIPLALHVHASLIVHMQFNAFENMKYLFLNLNKLVCLSMKNLFLFFNFNCVFVFKTVFKLFELHPVAIEIT